jgi:citrate synthase
MFGHRIAFRYTKQDGGGGGLDGMKIGSQDAKSSAISASNAESIVVRGHDLCRDLIGHISFTEHAWLLVTGSLPSPGQRQVLDAALVAIAEHGLVPSVAASRMTLAAAPEALQGAVAAGILGCGSVILGSAEAAGRFFTAVLARESGGDPNGAARTALVEARDAHRAVPGYGHPLHKRADPRVARLLAVAADAGIGGRHVEVARVIERLLPEVSGKPLAMNVSGAIAAVLLDAGFPLLAVKGVPILARTAGLIAHLLEEQERPIGFVLADSGAAGIRYDGESPDGFAPAER